MIDRMFWKFPDMAYSIILTICLSRIFFLHRSPGVSLFSWPPRYRREKLKYLMPQIPVRSDQHAQNRALRLRSQQYCWWPWCRGVVSRTLLVGLKGFIGPLPIPNLTFCSDFGGSAQSRGFQHSDFVENSRHLPLYNAGMPNMAL